MFCDVFPVMSCYHLMFFVSCNLQKNVAIVMVVTMKLERKKLMVCSRRSSEDYRGVKDVTKVVMTDVFAFTLY